LNSGEPQIDCSNCSPQADREQIPAPGGAAPPRKAGDGTVPRRAQPLPRRKPSDWSRELKWRAVGKSRSDPGANAQDVRSSAGWRAMAAGRPMSAPSRSPRMTRQRPWAEECEDHSGANAQRLTSGRSSAVGGASASLTSEPRVHGWGWRSVRRMRRRAAVRPRSTPPRSGAARRQGPARDQQGQGTTKASRHSDRLLPTPEPASSPARRFRCH